MTTPVDTPSTALTVDLDSLTQALGNAAERSAEKAAGNQDAAAAKDFAQAALAATQALMAIVAPRVAPPNPGGSSSDGAQSRT